MHSNNLQPTSFRLSSRNVTRLKAVRKETGLSYNQILSEMIRSYLKKLEKRRKVQKSE
jgi:predicted DNA-binding protein